MHIRSPYRFDSDLPPKHGSLGGTPPTQAPLHLALAWLLVCVSPLPMADNRPGPNVYSAPFVAAILEVIAKEAFEVNPTPATFNALRTETDRLVAKEVAAIARINAKLTARGQALSPEAEEAGMFKSWMDEFRHRFETIADGCSAIDTIERELRNRISEDADEPLEGPEPVERRSPLGMFFRRLMIKLRRALFDETSMLAAQTAEWCGVSVSDSVLPAWSMYRDVQDTSVDLRLSSMSKWEADLASGDYVGAVEAVRTFYESFGGVSDRPQHQHALLTLATFHYNTGSLDAAAEALEEAIRTARSSMDRDCLARCLSLRTRLKTEMDAVAWPNFSTPRVDADPTPLRRLGRATNPADELWALKAAIDMGEPVHNAFRRVYSALMRTRTFRNREDNGKERLSIGHLSIPAWHAAQASLWTMMGADALAEIHETLALSGPDLTGDVTKEVLRGRAERIAQEGRFDDALALLLDEPTVDNMTINDYRSWAQTVWYILERQVTLADDADAQAVLEGLRPSPSSSVRVGPGGPLRSVFDPTAAKPSRGIMFAHGQVTLCLSRARSRLDAHAPAHLVLSDVLAAHHLSSALGLWHLHRAASLALAETLLGLGLPRKAEQQAAAIWDEVTDNEGIARAALVRAKAWTAIAMGDADGADLAGVTTSQAEDTSDNPDATAIPDTPDTPAGSLDEAALERAAHFAAIATTHAAKLGARALHRDAAVLRAMIAELGGKTPDWTTELAAPELADRVRRVGEIVRLVGVRVAESWK